MQMCKNCFRSYDGDYDVCPYCGYVQSSDKREVYHLPVGTLLYGKYVIGRVLGSGGFGNTYKAWDKKFERFVAIKEYYPSGLVNRIPGNKEVIIYSQKRIKEYEHGKVRFLDEARNTVKFIDEPNIVDVYDFFEENNTAYFVMEYLEGVSLNAYLRKSEMGRLDLETATRIILKVATALEAVHKTKIVHRDIAPDNIFICNAGGEEVVKLIDFGAARFSKNEEELFTIILKPGYAPPEQYVKANEQGLNEQGPWTDVYALGATMYHLITGVKADESINRKVEDTVPYPHEIDPSIPVNVSNAIMTAMAIDRHMRFQSVTEFKRAIRGEKKVINLAQQKRRRILKRAIGIVASLAIVITGLVMFYLSWSRQRDEATVPTATIDVWCIESADYDLEESFAAITEQFKIGYNNDEVVINVTTFSEEEYLDKLEEAIENNEAPDLFETAGLDAEYLKDAVNLSDIVKDYFKNNCLFYDYYPDVYGDYKQVPLAFNYKVVYVNNVLYQEATGSKYEKDTAKDIQEIISAIGTSKDMMTSDYESFSGGTNIILDGSTKGYMSVVNNMAGKYHLVVLDNQEFVEDKDNGFCYEWSIISSDKDERKVAKKFLEFMLSDFAQSELEVTPNRNMLPINSKTLNTVVNDVFDELSQISEKAKE